MKADEKSKNPELEAFISEVDQKVRRMMSLEFETHTVAQINLQIGQGQIGLAITLVDKNLREGKRPMVAPAKGGIVQ